jgi:hypothetical protein
VQKCQGETADYLLSGKNFEEELKLSVLKSGSLPFFPQLGNEQ